MRSRPGNSAHANNAAFGGQSQGSGARSHQWHLEACQQLGRRIAPLSLKTLALWRYRDIRPV